MMFFDLLRRLRVVVTLIMVAVTAGCSSNDEEGPAVGAVTFLESGTTELEARGYDNSPRIAISGQVGSPYSVRVIEGGEWCWTSRRSQSTSYNGTLAIASHIFIIYLAANDEPNAAERTATIEVRVGDAEPVVLTVVQVPYDIPSEYDRAWAELPAYDALDDDDNIQYVTHYAPLSSTTTVRNFTIRYNREKRIAEWVAYPLHASYVSGGYQRLNAWGFDPEISRTDQANLTTGSYRGGGIRGHQCMSAHRWSNYDHLLNEQTYYSTNIMPQDYDFNSGSWLSMEGICSNNTCADTTYLVTGNHDIRSWSTDKSGTAVAMPKYCWKVLLRTRSGRTGKSVSEIESADELISIGYWAENSSKSKNGLKEYIVPVAYIEEQTGYKFFPMIREEIADEVKSQNNPSEWGIN